MNDSKILSDPWRQLRGLTTARIGLGRAGAGIPTTETLAFKLAHARARDAVHAELDPGKLSEGLRQIGLESVVARSRARDRSEYLRRPDLGRRLEDNRVTLPPVSPDLALILADGLSALAVERHSIPFLLEFLPLAASWSLSPVWIVTQARVAMGDEVGCSLAARATIILIGERPGLTSPDSLGIYYTYGPKVGLTDERRSCISNVHQGGISYAQAAFTLKSLIEASFIEKMSGVGLQKAAHSSPQPLGNAS